VKVSSGLTAR